MDKFLLIKSMTNSQEIVDAASIILSAVRSKRGLLTKVSDLSMINRQEFYVERFNNLRFYQVCRILVALAYYDRDLCIKTMKRIIQSIEEKAEQIDNN